MEEHQKRLKAFSSVKGSNKQTSLNPPPSLSSFLYVCCTPSCVSTSERRVVVSPHYHSPWRGIIPVVIPMALQRQIKVGKRKQNKTFRPFRQQWFMMFWGQCENGMVFRWNGFISLCGYSCVWTSWMRSCLRSDIWSGPAVEGIKLMTASCCFLALNPLHVI